MLGSNKEYSLLCVKPGLHRVIYGNPIIFNKTAKLLGIQLYFRILMIEKETASLKLL